MSIPTNYELRAEQEAMIKHWADKFQNRFGYDIIADFEMEELMECREMDMDNLWDEQLRNEYNEGMGV